VPNVVFFEIGADDPETAAIFYSRVFGWEIQQQDDGAQYWYLTTNDEDNPGIQGGLSHRFNELASTVNTIEVSSVDQTARIVTEEGGRVLAPKIAIPGEGYIQYCEDLEGNVFGIMEFDEHAA
jgi:uncharacterized protein